MKSRYWSIARVWGHVSWQLPHKLQTLINQWFNIIFYRAEKRTIGNTRKGTSIWEELATSIPGLPLGQWPLSMLTEKPYGGPLTKGSIIGPYPSSYPTLVQAACR